MIEPTGYCWVCGHSCPEGALFCSKKHKETYDKKQKREQAARVVKKAGYGISGSTQ